MHDGLEQLLILPLKAHEAVLGLSDVVLFAALSLQQAGHTLLQLALAFLKLCCVLQYSV